MLLACKPHDSDVFTHECSFVLGWYGGVNEHTSILTFLLINAVSRAVKKFLSSRLMMNSRRLWNSHQRHKFLRTKASRDILKFRVLEMAFPGVFSSVDAMLFRQNTRKTRNIAVEMFQAF